MLLIFTDPSVKSVRIRIYSCQHFPAFGLNTERYSVSLRIQAECEKMWVRITPNMDTFKAVTEAHTKPRLTSEMQLFVKTDNR